MAVTFLLLQLFFATFWLFERPSRSFTGDSSVATFQVLATIQKTLTHQAGDLPFGLYNLIKYGQHWGFNPHRLSIDCVFGGAYFLPVHQAMCTTNFRDKTEASCSLVAVASCVSNSLSHLMAFCRASSSCLGC